MVSVKITLQHFILVFTEVFCITSSLENYKGSICVACSLAFISPSMSKTVITCKGGFPLSRYFLRACTRCGLWTFLSKSMVVEEQRRQSLEHNHEMPFSKRFCRYLWPY